MTGAGHSGFGPDFRDLMSRTLCENALQEPDVRLGARMSGLRPGFPARRFQIGIWTSKLDLGRKWMISGAKFDGFCGWKGGIDGGKLDPLETKQIHGSKSTKHHQTNKSQ